MKGEKKMKKVYNKPHEKSVCLKVKDGRKEKEAVKEKSRRRTRIMSAHNSSDKSTVVQYCPTLTKGSHS